MTVDNWRLLQVEVLSDLAQKYRWKYRAAEFDTLIIHQFDGPFPGYLAIEDSDLKSYEVSDPEVLTQILTTRFRDEIFSVFTVDGKYPSNSQAAKKARRTARKRKQRTSPFPQTNLAADQDPLAELGL